LWKVHMKSILVFNDLWSVVDGSKNGTKRGRMDKERCKALALINISMAQG
ncbi:unnamed protein product, partial [Heterotrigona itama]